MIVLAGIGAEAKTPLPVIQCQNACLFRYMFVIYTRQRDSELNLGLRVAQNPQLRSMYRCARTFRSVQNENDIRRSC